MATSKANVKAKATAPSHIPQYNTIPTTTTTTTTIPPVTDPDLRPFFSRFSTSLRHSFSHRRPWFELIDRSTFCRPETLSEAASRVRKNASYFRVNYTAILIVVIAISVLAHPISLFFFLCLLWAWLFLYLFRPPDQPVFLFDRNFSDRETLGILIISTIFTVFLTGLGSLMIYSCLFGIGMTCIHGAFRVPQEVFVEDQEPDNTAGIISFLTMTAAAAAAVAPTPVVPRGGAAAPTMPRV